MHTTTAVRLTDTLALRVEARTIPAAPVPVLLPARDAVELADEDLGAAEGQSFIIDYTDAEQRRSVRRITVQAIKRGAAGVPTLLAFCHERRRTTNFRVDRIAACIDFDGVVHEDVPYFMFLTFGMPLDVGARTIDGGDQVLWQDFRALHLSHLVILAALSHADAMMLPDEVGAIVDWCCREATQFIGADPGEAFPRLAAAYVRRLRPHRGNIENAFDALAAEDPAGIVRLLRAAIDVVDADGRRHPAEIDLLNRLAEELTGVPLL